MKGVEESELPAVFKKVLGFTPVGFRRFGTAGNHQCIRVCWVVNWCHREFTKQNKRLIVEQEKNKMETEMPETSDAKSTRQGHKSLLLCMPVVLVCCLVTFVLLNADALVPDGSQAFLNQHGSSALLAEPVSVISIADLFANR